MFTSHLDEDMGFSFNPKAGSSLIETISHHVSWCPSHSGSGIFIP